jgi:hypothetical protein
MNIIHLMIVMVVMVIYVMIVKTNMSHVVTSVIFGRNYLKLIKLVINMVILIGICFLNSCTEQNKRNIKIVKRLSQL